MSDASPTRAIIQHYFELRVVDDHGNLLASLPEAELDSVSWVLNDFGQLDFSQSTFSQGADEIPLHECEIQLWMDGDLIWWGPAMTEGGGPGVQQIGCDELFSYFEERGVDDASLEFPIVDQFVIVQGLVEAAQSEAVQANRDRNIQFYAAAPSGKLRTQRYERSEHPIYADMIRDLTKAKDSFDFAIEIFGDGTRLFVPYYPRRGMVHQDVLFEYGRNLDDYTYEASAVDMATQTYYSGAGVPNSATGKIEAVYEDAAASGAFGVIQRFRTDGNQADPDWLLDLATKYTELHNTVHKVSSVTVVELEGMPVLGMVWPGDTVGIRIVDGKRVYNAMRRVSSMTYSGGTITFDFWEPPNPEDGE